MTTVHIQIDTGFGNAGYLHDTKLPEEEWESLTDDQRAAFTREALDDHIDTFPVVIDHDHKGSGGDEINY